MNSQDAFGSYAVGALVIFTVGMAVLDPNLMAMLLLAVPVPLVVWLVLAKVFASRADQTVEGGLA